MELHSPTIGEISKALVKAQKTMKPAKKTKINPFFKSKYADLEDVIEAVRKPFTDNGLSFFQSTLPHESAIMVVTTITHESGEWIRGYLPVRPVKNDPQSLGSAITYGKRYGLQALSGQPSEDDDGNKASEKKDEQDYIKEVGALLRGKNLDNKQQVELVNFYCEAKKIKDLDMKHYPNFVSNFETIFASWWQSGATNG